jgi:hypothetical protein
MLTAVGKAYGEPTAALAIFCASTLNAWATSKMYWPREGSKERKQIENISQKLCARLLDMRQVRWSGKEPQEHLDAELVRNIVPGLSPR